MITFKLANEQWSMNILGLCLNILTNWPFDLSFVISWIKLNGKLIGIIHIGTEFIIVDGGFDYVVCYFFMVIQWNLQSMLIIITQYHKFRFLVANYSTKLNFVYNWSSCASVKIYCFWIKSLIMLLILLTSLFCSLATMNEVLNVYIHFQEKIYEFLFCTVLHT